MKNLILLVTSCIIFWNSMLGQNVDLKLKNGIYTFTEVIEEENFNPSIGYNKFIQDYASSLQPASQLIWAPNIKTGIISTNESEKIITLVHSFDYPGKNYRCVIYRMKIEFREGRYRYEIRDITLSYATAVSGMTNEPLEKNLEKSNDKKKEKTLGFINSKISEDVKRMKSKFTSNSSSTDW